MIALLTTKYACPVATHGILTSLALGGRAGGRWVKTVNKSTTHNRQKNTTRPSKSLASPVSDKSRVHGIHHRLQQSPSLIRFGYRVAAGYKGAISIAGDKDTCGNYRCIRSFDLSPTRHSSLFAPHGSASMWGFALCRPWEAAAGAMVLIRSLLVFKLPHDLSGFISY